MSSFDEWIFYCICIGGMRNQGWIRKCDNPPFKTAWSLYIHCTGITSDISAKGRRYLYHRNVQQVKPRGIDLGTTKGLGRRGMAKLVARVYVYHMPRGAQRRNIPDVGSFGIGVSSRRAGARNAVRIGINYVRGTLYNELYEGPHMRARAHELVQMKTCHGHADAQNRRQQPARYAGETTALTDKRGSESVPGETSRHLCGTCCCYCTRITGVCAFVVAQTESLSI